MVKHRNYELVVDVSMNYLEPKLEQNEILIINCVRDYYGIIF